MRDIGKNIRRAREQKGYGQEQLAELLFVTRQTVSNYETGRSRPDVDTLVKLAGLLDVEVTELIYGTEPCNTGNRRALWLRIGASILLIGVNIWLTSFAADYAQRYYSELPNGIRLMLLLPCLWFELGQLAVELLRLVWKAKSVHFARGIRIICAVWIVFYTLCTIPVLVAIFTSDFVIPQWLGRLALMVVGGGAGIPKTLYLSLFFLSGAGLALTETRSWETK